jgi:molecular chaperone DnaK
VAYGFNKGFDEKVLVFDLGGGTFDISVLHVKGNEFKVLATGGDTFLGGVDFDTRLAAWVIERFTEATKKDISQERVAVQRIRAASERAKRDLSQEKRVKMQLPYVTEVSGEPVDLHLEITREQLNKLTADLVDRTLSMCDEVLQRIGLKHSDLNEILLVGGQTRMPLVQNKIHQHFGKPPRKGVHPDEVVALGAAILANPEEFKASPKLRDVLSIPIGIALPSGRFKPVLDRNTPIPAGRSYRLTLSKNEPIEIDIYQGESARILENEYLGTFAFPAPPKGSKREQKLEMRFDLSEECLLTVEARDTETGQKTAAQLLTTDTPKSLRDSMEQAVKDEKEAKPGWFKAFAQRVLKK